MDGRMTAGITPMEGPVDGMTSAGQRYQKQNRVPLACIQCRNRKVRCDGTKPQCERCKARGQLCSYEGRRKRVRYNMEYVRQLESKLRQLSDSRSQLPPDMPPPTANVVQDGDIKSSELSEQEISERSEPSEPSERSERSGPSSVNDEEPNDYATTDAMGAGSVHGNQELEFYGSSAAVSFIRLVEAAIGSRQVRGAKGLSSTRLGYRFSYLHNTGTDIGSGDEWILPPKPVADYYVKQYFTFVYTLYPFMHEPSFTEAYESIWGDRVSPKGGTISINDDNRLFFCILNIVFAFGCLFTSGFDTPSTESSSEVYFQRACQQLNFNIFGTKNLNSLLLLQALLMLGQYLQATDKPASCWNVVGLATRIAQELGLHREGHIRLRRSLIEQQLCRRLWYGCILMDRTVSMTFGRPLMILSDHKVVPPEFIDDKYITDDKIQRPDPASRSVLQFFEQTLKLYEVLADVIRFYENVDSTIVQTEEERLSILSNILQLQGKLRKFKLQIPECLRLEKIDQYGPAIQMRRLTNVLQIRIWHLEIMLFRPILMPHSQTSTPGKSTLASNMDDDLEDSMEKAVRRLCIMSAIRLIDLIYKNQNTTNLPNMWYNIFYVYTAAIVLLAAKLQPDVSGAVDEGLMEISWKNTVFLLRSFEKHSLSATRCLKVLKLIHEKISEASTAEKRLFEILPGPIDLSGGDRNIIDFMCDQNAPFIDQTMNEAFFDVL
uniref:ARAD1A07062p n=1 Tax=Blastobotrys adeninivorans TaxID=409370 RepID=A0A060T359_BLAAD